MPLTSPPAIVAPSPDENIIRAPFMTGRVLEDLPDSTLVQPLEPTSLTPIGEPIEMPFIRHAGMILYWDRMMDGWAL
jgi:hypothetical protein